MKEYRIITQYGKGKPFSLETYTNYEICIIKLNEYIERQKQLDRKYFVLNNFFENEFQLDYDTTKYKIECREVEEWTELGKTKKENKGKILSFEKYKAVL